ncbi:MAG: hypothetical protein U0790_06260 [Isosphaeraceae bacterium]
MDGNSTNMITRKELKALQSKQDYPSVSILAPTHRTAPANQRDPIVVKNLLNSAVERLHSEFSKREVAAVVQNLNRLVAQTDWEHLQEGLALFASRSVATAVQLPFKVKARVMVDATFATRDLVFTLNRAPRYRVLVLGEKPTRLFDASTNVLTEHRAKAFPMVHKGAGGASKLPGGKGVNISAVRDESHRQFFQKVDEAVAALQSEEKFPIVLAGIERFLGFYQEVTKDPDSIVAMLSGSYEGANPSSLGKAVWPLFQAGSTQRRTRALARLSQAVSVNRHASGIDRVWRAVFDNQCQILLVEKEFAHPADVSDDGTHLLRYTGKGPQALDDAVDDVIEKALATGAEVFFYEPGVLDLHQGIAAVLRY